LIENGHKPFLSCHEMFTTCNMNAFFSFGLCWFTYQTVSNS